ncbi:MAG: DUF1698 domain-containing protein, partial [Deltaproteobacteria bacterium]|nr:DUF1698 domain-containing protein [Deltaproteobacteria bacterium]
VCMLLQAPANFNADKFFHGVFWYQKWELYRGVFTPGINDIAQMCQDLGLPEDLSGKRVLDVGAWNGCLSFECERRGASEIIALGPEDPVVTGFHKIRRAVASKKVQYVRGSVYDLSPRRLGYFNIVLFCGVLYHLRYPLLGIDNLRRVCKGDVFIESYIIDSRIPVPKNTSLGDQSANQFCSELAFQPFWQFFRKDELAGDPSNWFGPNQTAVLEAFRSAGFYIQPKKHRKSRATFHATVREEQPEFLTIKSCEGMHYDIVMSKLFEDANPARLERIGKVRFMIDESLYLLNRLRRIASTRILGIFERHVTSNHKEGWRQNAA